MLSVLLQITLSMLSMLPANKGLNWGDPTRSQIRYLLFEIHYL